MPRKAATPVALLPDLRLVTYIYCSSLFIILEVGVEAGQNLTALSFREHLGQISMGGCLNVILDIALIAHCCSILRRSCLHV